MLTNRSWSTIEGNFCSPKNIINSDDSDSESESDEDSGFDNAFDCKSEVNCNKSKSNTSKLKDIPGLTESLSHVHVSIPKNKTSPKTIETKKLHLKRKSLTGLILKQRRRLLRNSVIHRQASIKWVSEKFTQNGQGNTNITTSWLITRGCKRKLRKN